MCNYDLNFFLNQTLIDSFHKQEFFFIIEQTSLVKYQVIPKIRNSADEILKSLAKVHEMRILESAKQSTESYEFYIFLVKNMGTDIEIYNAFGTIFNERSKMSMLGKNGSKFCQHVYRK